MNGEGDRAILHGVVVGGLICLMTEESEFLHDQPYRPLPPFAFGSRSHGLRKLYFR